MVSELSRELAMSCRGVARSCGASMSIQDLVVKPTMLLLSCGRLWSQSRIVVILEGRATREGF